MKVEFQLTEEDALLLQSFQSGPNPGTVSDVFLTALHRMAQQEESEQDASDLLRSAHEGLASGWYEGDPFQPARQVLAAGVKRRQDAA